MSLKSVATYTKGGYITKQNAISGDVPVISGGLEPAFYHNTSNRDGESIVIARSGVNAGHVSYWSTPIYVSDTFTIDPNTDILTYKYLYHCLKTIQNKIIDSNRGAGVPHINKESLSKFVIPIIDIDEQIKITKLLDNFNKLCNDLSNGIPAEIKARKKQYEHYRDKLLSFEDYTVVKTSSEVV